MSGRGDRAADGLPRPGLPWSRGAGRRERFECGVQPGAEAPSRSDEITEEVSAAAPEELTEQSRPVDESADESDGQRDEYAEPSSASAPSSSSRSDALKKSQPLTSARDAARDDTTSAGAESATHTVTPTPAASSASTPAPSSGQPSSTNGPEPPPVASASSSAHIECGSALPSLSTALTRSPIALPVPTAPSIAPCSVSGSQPNVDAMYAA